MRRLVWLLLAIAAAAITVGVSAASAKTEPVTTVKLTATPTTVTPTMSVDFTAVVNHDGVADVGDDVALVGFVGGGCNNFWAWDFMNAGTTTYTYNDFNYWPGLGTYSFLAYDFNADVESSCVNVNVVKALPAETSTFLCYSKFQTDPAVYPMSKASSLLAQGYWKPWAVKGNVTGGTNVGDYHLVCNLTAGQAETGKYADNDGYAQPSIFGDMLGVYPVAG